MTRRLRFFLAGCLLLLAAAGSLLYALLGDLPAPSAIPARLHTPTIRIVDRHGRLLYDVLDPHGGRHVPLPLDAIPLTVRQATIATEDRNFYSNPGVDLGGIVRAFWINLRGGEVLAGGSTITQQVARNLLLDADERAERTVARKLRESWLAWRVARALDKDTVLALYLNQMYYGALAYGVEAAAQTYFAKPAADLTVAESALIVGLTQAPAVYNPLVDPAAAKARQLTVLDLMVKAGYLSQADRDQAAREPLRYAAAPYPLHAPHFVQMVQAQLDTLLTPAQLAAGAGLVVHTTLDLDWQERAEAVIAAQWQRLNHPPDGSPSHNAGSAALVALHPQTGDVLALVGNVGDGATPGSAINMATTPRQPGSAMKPMIYAAALAPDQAEPWTAATPLPDVRTAFVTHDGEPYVPVNFSRTENGPVLLRQALASSLNIPAVRTLDKVGVAAALALAADFGMAVGGSAEELDLSLALGGGAVSLLDLTRGYAVFANGGGRITPRLITAVDDAQGRRLVSAEPTPLIQVIDARVAWLISDILSDNQARELSFGAHSVLNIDRTAAVKTGTTNDFRDNWTVGYTPDLVVGVWVGNVTHEPMHDVSGVSGAGPIWHQFMRSVLGGVPDRPFAQPPGLVQVEVCALSGLMPTDACPHRRRDWFLAGTQPTAVDTFYRTVTLDRRTGAPATATTPPGDRVTRLVLDLPEMFHAWARAEGLALWGDWGGDSAESGPVELRLLTPDPNTTFRIATTLPRANQQIRLEAVGPARYRSVTLVVDDRPLATLDQPPYAAWWPLTPGTHVAWAEGHAADGTRFRSAPVPFTVKDVGDD